VLSSTTGYLVLVLAASLLFSSLFGSNTHPHSLYRLLLHPSIFSLSVALFFFSLFIFGEYCFVPFRHSVLVDVEPVLCWI
jgi:hypothetical protein